MTGSSHLNSFGGDMYDRNPMPDYVVTTNNGFRCWELTYDARVHTAPADPDVHHLSSLVQKYEWHEGLNVAGCLLSESARVRRQAKNQPLCTYPTKRCECGFYAYYGIDHWSQHPSRSARYQRVDGIIEGYGRSVVGSKGFRSEFAVIVGLVIPPLDELSTAWLGYRTKEQGREDVANILRAKLPLTPLYDSVEELLEAVPLLGKPQIVRDLEDQEEAS